MHLRPGFRHGQFLLSDHGGELLSQGGRRLVRAVKDGSRQIHHDGMHAESDEIKMLHQPRDPLRILDAEEELAGEGESDGFRERVNHHHVFAGAVRLQLLPRDGIHLAQVAHEGFGLEEARLPDDLRLLRLLILWRRRCGRRGLALVGAEEVLHGVRAEGSEVGLLVGEDEFVALGAANDGGFLAEDPGLEYLRRVFPHPVADEFFRLAEQEVDGFSYDRPPEAAGREFGAAAAAAREENESDDDDREG